MEEEGNTMNAEDIVAHLLRIRKSHTTLKERISNRRQQALDLQGLLAGAKVTLPQTPSSHQLPTDPVLQGVLRAFAERKVEVPIDTRGILAAIQDQRAELPAVEVAVRKLAQQKVLVVEEILVVKVLASPSALKTQGLRVVVLEVHRERLLETFYALNPLDLPRFSPWRRYKAPPPRSTSKVTTASVENRDYSMGYAMPVPEP